MDYDLTSRNAHSGQSSQRGRKNPVCHPPPSSMQEAYPTRPGVLEVDGDAIGHRDRQSHTGGLYEVPVRLCADVPSRFIGGLDQDRRAMHLRRYDQALKSWQALQHARPGLGYLVGRSLSEAQVVRWTRQPSVEMGTVPMREQPVPVAIGIRDLVHPRDSHAPSSRRSIPAPSARRRSSMRS